MLKVNETKIENVKFNGKELDKIIVNGVTVFEKSKENIITMRTLNSIRLIVQTQDSSPCEVWNDGVKIADIQSNDRLLIDIPNKNIDVILKGRNINVFNCKYNRLTSLDVQGLTALQYLICSGNRLTSLDVQGLTVLQWLSCSDNQLTSLHVQSLTALQTLDCSYNRLTSLDVQGLTVLQWLSCSDNQLTSLHVQGLTALQYLSCNYNPLTSLDVQGLTALQTLICSSDRLTSLDVQGLTALQYLECSNNRLTSLDVQGLTSLQTLNCNYNQLTSLDVQGLTALQTLDCGNNRLTAQAFTDIFNHLPIKKEGLAMLYNDGDSNYKDFTRPPELVKAFNSAKMRGWKFYKNYINDSNLL